MICDAVTLEVTTGQSLAVIGPNGSGKSTFVKLLAGLIRPDRGTVSYRSGGAVITSAESHRYVGLVSPELSLYEELTGYENLRFAASVLDLGARQPEFDALLEEFGLSGRGDDLVRTYSSGMKHRLKFAAALLKNPPLLLLDEPTVMLDDDGTARVWAALASRRLALIIATNDAAEAERAERKIVMGVKSA